MKNGFTLIELMIIIAIIGLLVAIGSTQWQKYKDPNWRRDQIQKSKNVDKPSFQCVGGYKFVVDKDGSLKQIIGSNGGGVECFN